MSSLLETRFDVLNVLLHHLNEDLIVKVNDVLLFSIFKSDLQVNALDTSLVLVLENVSILVDHIIEGNLQLWLNFTDAIDGAHNKLVQVSVNEELRFHGKLVLLDRPNFLLNFL